MTYIGELYVNRKNILSVFLTTHVSAVDDQDRTRHVLAGFAAEKQRRAGKVGRRTPPPGRTSSDAAGVLHRIGAQIPVAVKRYATR